MARILDEHSSENSWSDDGYAAHNDLGLQLSAFEISFIPPPDNDNRLHKTSTTQHADSDPLLNDTESAPTEANDSQYDISQYN